MQLANLSTELEIKVGTTTQLATVTWDGKTKLFYQAADNTIQELTRLLDGTWFTLHEALPGSQPHQGTHLTAVGWADVHVRVYYQVPDNSIWEAVFDGEEWDARQLIQSGNKAIRGRLDTPISAIVHLSDNGVRC